MRKRERDAPPGEPKVEVGEALDSADRDAMASVLGQAVMQMLDSIGSAPWFGEFVPVPRPEVTKFRDFRRNIVRWRARDEIYSIRNRLIYLKLMAFRTVRGPSKRVARILHWSK